MGRRNKNATTTPQSTAGVPISEWLADRETQWYRSNGHYQERVRIDRDGQQYVVGDWSWHRNHPEKSECIEPRMERDGVYVG